MSGLHPSDDLLADHAAGVLPEAERDQVAGHVGGCERCQELLTECDEVADLLGSLDDPQMPPEVSDRITAALATAALAHPAEPPAAPSATVTPLASHRARRTPRFAQLGAVAASVAVIAAGVLGVRALTNGSSAGGTDSGAASSTAAGGSAEAATPVTRSGTDWTPETLRTDLPQLLTTAYADKAPAAAPTQAQRDTAADAAPLAAAGAAEEGLEPLAGGPTQAACVAALAGDSTTTPLAVDLARYEGKPAAVVVLPSPGDAAKVDIWVVGAGCDTDVRYFLRTAR